MTPRAAIVIPCFNDGRFLADAVESARAQEACEVVVVDDGSDDHHTLAVLAELERGGTRIVRQPNGGLSAARMAGVAATNARYVHPLDADDRLAAGAITALADLLDRRSEADAAWGDLLMFGNRQCRVPGARALDPWRITYLAEVPGPALIRRSALEDVGGWDMGSGYEDWDFWMKAAERRWRTAYVPMVTVHYREHPTPRMYVQSRMRHRELVERLSSRHPSLFAARGRNWRRSHTRWPVKLTWPLIRRLPRIDDLDRERLLIVVRDTFEPWTRIDCAPSTGRRVLRYLKARRSARDEPAPLAPGQQR